MLFGPPRTPQRFTTSLSDTTSALRLAPPRVPRPPSNDATRGGAQRTARRWSPGGNAGRRSSDAPDLSRIPMSERLAGPAFLTGALDCDEGVAFKVRADLNCEGALLRAVVAPDAEQVQQLDRPLAAGSRHGARPRRRPRGNSSGGLRSAGVRSWPATDGCVREQGDHVVERALGAAARRRRTPGEDRGALPMCRSVLARILGQ